MKSLQSELYTMKARLLFALAGVVCAALVFALPLQTQEEVIAVTAVPTNHFLRLPAPDCKGPGICPFASGCVFECGSIRNLECCTAEGYYGPACELCGVVVTP